VLRATLESFRRLDQVTDSEKVARLLDEYRGGGLAVVGVEDTLAALEAGQVDEVLLTSAPIALDRDEDADRDETGHALSPEDLQERERVAGDLVARARRTGAEVKFIEDANLLWDVGGVGAFLRYRLTPAGPVVPPVDLLGMDF
jgi:peptide subunit release factor 1 (eRF1)